MKTDLSFWDTHQLQKIFQSLMTAFSYPGSIQKINTETLDQAIKRVCACLMDNQVSLYSCISNVSEDFQELLQVQSGTQQDADFMILDGKNVDSTISPKLGTLDNPHLSTTLLFMVERLSTESESIQLEGPGIQDKAFLHIEGLDTHWLKIRNQLCSQFPLGVDCIFVDSQALVAIPRSITLTLES